MNLRLFPWSLAALAVIVSRLESDGATLLGQDVVPGGRAEIRFPVSPYFQNIAAQNNNPRVETGRAVLMFPPAFDPARPWPIMIVTSTSDFGRTSPMDAEWYRKPAAAEGWVVLASDATIRPRVDSTPWRLAMLAAALEAIREAWPQTARWPVAFFGFSGGAKRSALLGAMLAKSGAVKPRGFFLSGMNEDKMSEAYRDYRPGPSFLKVPVWLSAGVDDKIAPLTEQNKVRESMQRTGFSNVRLETFAGGHNLKLSEIRNALRWFRASGGF